MNAGPKPQYQGYIEQLSRFHVEGWMHNRADGSERTALTVRRGDTGEVIATDIANHFRYGLSEIGIGDGGHGFHVRFPTPLAPEALPHLKIVPEPGGTAIETAPTCTNAYEPMMLISMDIVDNCNLRCPFCFYDYSGVRTTNLMDEATVDAALAFLPYVTDGNFWFSCVHEPTLHPDLMRFIEKVPRQWRKKVFFTTNLAKRMPDRYFAWLADAGLHHVNISIESMVPELYERMRKGARFRIFKKNWDALIEATAQHTNPTKLRYIAMVYRSNYRELPGLVRFLLDERHAGQVELRYTFDLPHIPAAFRDSEFLDAAGWLWLRDQLAEYPAERVMLILPPGIRPETPRLAIDLAERFEPETPNLLSSGVRHYLPGRYESRLCWDGSFTVTPFWAHPFEESLKTPPVAVANIRDVGDPLRFLAALSA